MPCHTDSGVSISGPNAGPNRVRLDLILGRWEDSSSAEAQPAWAGVSRDAHHQSLGLNP